MVTTMISSQGQVTLPRKMMNRINLKPKDEVQIEIVDGGIAITPISKSVLDEIADIFEGQIDPKLLGKPWEEVREIVYKKMAEEIANEDLSD